MSRDARPFLSCPLLSHTYLCEPCLGQAPLDHATVTLDFKGEVKALVDLLHRAPQGIR
jgi:hypothetical protein